MKRTLPLLLTLLVLITSGPLQPTAAQTREIIDNEESDDAAPIARVARLSFTQGDVSFLRAGVTEWAPAVENLPLLAGDRIYAARGARAEIQLARGNYIRLSENTELTIAELSDGAAQLEISEGVLVIRVERIAAAFPRFEVDTPNSAVLLRNDGLYRIDVRGEKESQIIVRGGEAEVSTDEGTFKVREGHRLLVDTAAAGRIELAIDTVRDDWDQWSYDRDQTIARTSIDLAPASVVSYETTYNEFYGVSDLSSYGTWTSYPSYGQCWIPRVSSGWAPYRLGQWIWIPAAGWTWLSSEPWGWAPYHYGRWAYLTGLGWAWVPGFGSYGRVYGYRDYRWRPALVYFFNCSTPSRHYVGWHPLAPGERWHRPDRRGRDDDRAHRPDHPNHRRRPGDGRMEIQPIRPGDGTTILPVEAFTSGDRRANRPAAPGREVADSIKKGARAGLPEIKPAPIASAPSLDDSDRRTHRRIAVPPNELITRPVVTRNQDPETPSAGAARERRLISPPEHGQGPALIERESERRADRKAKSVGGSDPTAAAPRIQIPHPASSDGNSSRSERRDDRSLAAPGQDQPRSESREQLRQQRRLEREQQQDGPRPENREQLRQQRRLEREQPQEQPRSQAGEQTRQERRQERPRQEQAQPQNREQVRQERRQEREQRQEQSRSESRERPRQERHQERQQQQEQRRRP